MITQRKMIAPRFNPGGASSVLDGCPDPLLNFPSPPASSQATWLSH